MSGGVVAFSLAKISGALRFNTFVRLASPEMELNDAGLVPLINDKSIRNSISHPLAATHARGTAAHFGLIETENHWTSGGVAERDRRCRLHGGVTMKNNWGWALTYALNNPTANYCTSCARGGPALRTEPSQSFQVNVSGDNRRAVVPQLEWAVGAADGGPVVGAARIGRRRPAPVVAILDVAERRREQARGQPAVDRELRSLPERHDALHVRAPGTDDSEHDGARVVHGDAAAHVPVLRPAVHVGRVVLSDWRELDAPRAADYDDRFAPYARDVAPGGFNFKQFNSNAVVRWEYRPGSTLFFVWQQGRLQDATESRDVRVRARLSRPVSRAPGQHVPREGYVLLQSVSGCRRCGGAEGRTTAPTITTDHESRGRLLPPRRRNLQFRRESKQRRLVCITTSEVNADRQARVIPRERHGHRRLTGRVGDRGVRHPLEDRAAARSSAPIAFITVEARRAPSMDIAVFSLAGGWSAPCGNGGPATTGDTCTG